MRKSLIIFLLLGGFGLGVGLFNNLVKSGEVTSQTPSPLPSNAAVRSEVLSEVFPVITNPTTFSIPKLGINSYVEHVGLNKDGAMDIPKDDANVAWYNLGARPGEKGSAVIAGHFDTKTGAPAVFYEINKLEEGDEIAVSGPGGEEVKFKVERVVSYELADFPLQKVFAANDKPRLNLITCEGVYNKSSKLYSHRLVVYSEVID